MREKIYAAGIFGVVFGLAGISEHITSGRGSFMVSAIIFAISFGCVLYGYTDDE